MQPNVALEVDWDGLNRRIAEAARSAAALHVDALAKDAEHAGNRELIGLRGTQAEGLLAWVRQQNESRFGVETDGRGVAR